MMKKSKGRKSTKRSMRATSPGRRKVSSRGSSRRKVSGRRSSTIKEPSEIFTL